MLQRYEAFSVSPARSPGGFRTGCDGTGRLLPLVNARPSAGAERKQPHRHSCPAALRCGAWVREVEGPRRQARAGWHYRGPATSPGGVRVHAAVPDVVPPEDSRHHELRAASKRRSCHVNYWSFFRYSTVILPTAPLGSLPGARAGAPVVAARGRWRRMRGGVEE